MGGGLNSFINKKLREYREPERAGKSKGETIGLSRDKYHGCLLRLTNKHPKDIAKELGVSYSLMRRWMVDDNFKKLRDELYEELKTEFVLLVTSKIIRLDEECLNEKKILEFFSDAKQINFELKKQIIFTMEIYSPRVTGHRMILMLQILKMFISEEGKTNDIVNKKIRSLIKLHGGQLLRLYQQAHSKKELTESEISDLLLLLALVLEVMDPG